MQNKETFFSIFTVINSIRLDYFDNAAIVQDCNQILLNYVPKMHTTWSDKTQHVIILPETAAGWFMCIKIDSMSFCVVWNIWEKDAFIVFGD